MTPLEEAVAALRRAGEDLHLFHSRGPAEECRKEACIRIRATLEQLTTPADEPGPGAKAWLLSLNCSTDFGRGTISWQQADGTRQEVELAFEQVLRSSAPGVVADASSFSAELIDV